MPRWAKGLLVAMLCGPAGWAAGAWATQFAPRSVDERVALADAVVEVTVQAATAAWVDGRVVTFVSADVHRWFKGPGGDEVLVGVPGGVVGDLGQRVYGAPGLEVGARYVLLLGPGLGPDGARGLVMLEEGVFGAAPGGSDEPVRFDSFGERAP